MPVLVVVSKDDNGDDGDEDAPSASFVLALDASAPLRTIWRKVGWEEEER